MLTKIGDAWVDLSEIAAAEHLLVTGLDEEFVAIILRCGERVAAHCSPEEFEAVLAGAELLWGVKRSVEDFLGEDRPTLEALYEEGFRYLARDIDGKIYAYRHEPRKDGAYWDPVYQTENELKPLHREQFQFITSEDDLPFALEDIYC